MTENVKLECGNLKKNVSNLFKMLAWVQQMNTRYQNTLLLK